MAYFTNFPLRYHEFDGKQKLVTDILIRSTFTQETKNAIQFYRTYSVEEAERPEHVAFKFYNDPDLYWIVLLYNEVHNPFFEWPMSQNELLKYCQEVYGETGMNQVRHYVDVDGIVVGEVKEYDYEDPEFVWIPPANLFTDSPDIIPVTHYDFEEARNEERREINLPRPELVKRIIRQFEDSLNG